MRDLVAMGIEPLNLGYCSTRSDLFSCDVIVMDVSRDIIFCFLDRTSKEIVDERALCAICIIFWLEKSIVGCLKRLLKTSYDALHVNVSLETSMSLLTKPA